MKRYLDSNGKVYREEYESGSEMNYDEEGQPHKENEPALITTSGDRAWFLHGKRHRTDGPAIEYADGTKHWFYRDKFIDCQSQIEFDRFIKMKAFW